LVRLRASSAKKRNMARDERPSVKQKAPLPPLRNLTPFQKEEEEKMNNKRRRDSKDGPLAKLRFSTPGDRIKYKKSDPEPPEEKKNSKTQALATLKPLSAREQYGAGSLGAPPGGASFGGPLGGGGGFSRRGPPPPQIKNSFGAAAMAELEKKRAAGMDTTNNGGFRTKTTSIAPPTGGDNRNNNNNVQNGWVPDNNTNEVNQFDSDLNDALGLVSNLEQELSSAMKDQQTPGETGQNP